jgi:hypothetical protein
MRRHQPRDQLRRRERLKRPGFERLRNVITRHRRAWADQHLERWLEHGWQTDL